MTWISKHQPIWRTAVLVLLIVSFVGPWTGDRIHIPAEYPCSGPYLRVGDDMCNLIGFVGVAYGVLSLAGVWATGTLINSELIQPLLFLGSCLLSVLPFFTTLLLIALAKRHHKLHILAWSLAVAASLLFVLWWAPPSWMWGPRLYIWVAIGALVLELTAVMTDRRSGLTLNGNS